MLQTRSYFSRRFEGLTTRGAFYLFFSKKDSSLAFRYDNISGKVILDDYDNRPANTAASFLFTISGAINVKFLEEDCKGTK